MVCMSVCLSVTRMHSAKAFEWNEMPFGVDTYVILSNIVLDSHPSPSMVRGDLAGQNPSMR